MRGIFARVPFEKIDVATLARFAANHGLLLTLRCEMKIVISPPRGGILIF